MGNMSWVTYKEHEGVRHMGSNRYNPPEPWGPWTKIMGVIARCEGNHDTVVSYDGTGVTWGFLQWTFTSGRLQRLLASMKSIPVYDFETNKDDNLFDRYFLNDEGSQLFLKYGFEIHNGRFYSHPHERYLNPAKPMERRMIDDVCMGRCAHPDKPKKQKTHAKGVAKIFADAGALPDVAAAQIHYAKTEFKTSLPVERKPLVVWQSIEHMLVGTWETPIPALFFNLWQNHPSQAYKFFQNQFDSGWDHDDSFNHLWERLSKSKFGNWGYGSKLYKQKGTKPRVFRIRKAMKEFYNLDLPVIKP